MQTTQGLAGVSHLGSKERAKVSKLMQGSYLLAHTSSWSAMF